ncbi:hypothetical protein PWT90_03452 [Aphanocladium album]|nr:hypothetical protein PWT90_03452 [Aphanocladium album]
MLSFGMVSLATLASTVLGATVSYDTGFDDGNRALLRVACSDGDNGLITRYKWQTQAEIPRFPYIGGASAVAGWNSPNCGTCWKLEYRNRTINFLAVDHADAGFNIGLHALDELTGGRAVEIGRIEAVASQVDVKQCGL